MEDYLKELFATPTGLEPAYQNSGMTFYSSPKLKQNFILAFEKSSKGKHVASEVKRLIEKDIIIPCYKSKNLFGFIKRKLFKNPDNYILAFYSIEDKKVIVLVENTSSIFGTSSNNELASNTMHECMHLASARNISKFMQIFLPYLNEYYTEFFTDYLDLKSKEPKKTNDIIRYMVQFEKNGPMYANSKLADFYRLIENSFISNTTLKENEFKIRLTNLIVASKLFILSMPTLIKNERRYSMVFTSLNRAYLKTFGKKNTYTFPIQEMISLSEVACVLAEMKPKDSSIKKLFQIIA